MHLELLSKIVPPHGQVRRWLAAFQGLEGAKVTSDLPDGIGRMPQSIDR